MTDWMEIAQNVGFDTAAPIDPKALTAREDVRDMCAADKCGAYGKNWTCPPACGTVETTLESILYRRNFMDYACGNNTELGSASF